MTVIECTRLIDGVKCKAAEDIERLNQQGNVIREVPPSRHAWGDVIVCPNNGCDRQFLIVKRAEGL